MRLKPTPVALALLCALPLKDKAYHERLAEGVSGEEIQAVGRSLQVTWQGAF